ncbi:hypothetical protein AB9P05_15185 [Roseivirga sp. BDSF3-8]|uniref:hypothetical protein n=1 Tax=Roseivirga sp. BDSF3-8 TaxID=3241598 RepID=UPI003531DD3A
MFSNFSGWWETLETFERIYWILAVPFTVLFLFQLIIIFVGGDVDIDDGTDGIDGDHDFGEGGFHLLTIKNLIGFFTIFSWTGLACIDAGLANVLTVVISVICGLLMMVIMASIFYFMSKLTADKTMNLETSLYQTGEVYLRVPALRGGVGKVHITVQGTLRELDAVTDDEDDLSTGTVITVTDVINGNLLIVTKSSAYSQLI